MSTCQPNGGATPPPPRCPRSPAQRRADSAANATAVEQRCRMVGKNGGGDEHQRHVGARLANARPRRSRPDQGVQITSLSAGLSISLNSTTTAENTDHRRRQPAQAKDQALATEHERRQERGGEDLPTTQYSGGSARLPWRRWRRIGTWLRRSIRRRAVNRALALRRDRRSLTVASPGTPPPSARARRARGRSTEPLVRGPGEQLSISASATIAPRDDRGRRPARRRREWLGRAPSRRERPTSRSNCLSTAAPHVEPLSGSSSNGTSGSCLTDVD